MDNCPNCERLTAELAQAKRAYLEWTDEDEALAGLRERDRLRLELEVVNHQRAAMEVEADGYSRRLRAENNRLRAALERIAANPGHDLDEYFDDVSAAAREALAGAAETSPVDSQTGAKLNAAYNIGQEIGHVKRTADETSAKRRKARCPHGVHELNCCNLCDSQ